jgi:hypothetical protein
MIAPYTGVVATNCSNVRGGSTTDSSWMSRSLHTAAVSITALQLVFANWYINITADVAGGTSATYTASIEYPAGSFTPVKFSGASSGVAASGATLVSDSTAVSIPAGASFFVRNYRVHAAGSFKAPYTSWGATFNQSAGDACTHGSGSAVTDQTLGGTVVNTTAYWMAPPVAIIGTTNLPSYLVIGDSRITGFNTVLGQQTDTNPCTGELSPSLFNAGIGFIASGLPSDTAAYWAAGDYPLSQGLATYTSDVISNHSINDLNNSGTAAQLLANQQTLRSVNFAGKRYWICTLAPYTTSSDSYATLANQTVVSSNAQRIAYNTAVRAGVPSMFGYLDIASRVESSLNSGFWKVNGTANYATADGLHESPNATALIAAVPLGIPSPQLLLGGNGGLLNIAG